MPGTHPATKLAPAFPLADLEEEPFMEFDSEKLEFWWRFVGDV
jgi:hypothetical protein